MKMISQNREQKNPNRHCSSTCAELEGVNLAYTQPSVAKCIKTILTEHVNFTACLNMTDIVICTVFDIWHFNLMHLYTVHVQMYMTWYLVDT